MTHRYDADRFQRHELDRDRSRPPEERYRDEQRPEWFGQREPYSSQQWDPHAPDQAGPRHGRGDWNSRPDESRYSESQYGQRRFAQERPDAPPAPPRWNGGGYEDDYPNYRGARDVRGYTPPSAEEWRRSRSYGVGYSGSDDNYLPFGNRSSYGPGGRYETQASGAGGVGYMGDPRGRDQPRPGLLGKLFNRGPKGYQRSDERLREDISERLMQAGNIDSSEVSVSVSSGAVTLEGTVPDRYMKHSIEDLVDACPGVQDIDNRIRVNREWYRGSGPAGTTVGSAGSSASSAANGRRKDS